jgi:putative ABC transport system permease protein
VTVSGEAMKTFVVGEVNKLSSSDFILASERSIDPQLIDDVRNTEGVTGVAPLRTGVTTIYGGMPAFFTTGDLEELGDVAGMPPVSGSLDSVTDGPGIAVADLSQFGGGGGGQPALRLGDVVPVVGADGQERDLTVEVLLEEAGFDSFFIGYLVGEETFVELVGEQPISFAFVRVEPGTADAVGQRIERSLQGYTGVEVQPGNFVGQIIGNVFDFLIGAVNALLGMSVVVALVGIVNTLTLSIFERRRELGMVRALGMTRQQVGRMIRLEGVLIGLLGTIVGMGSGILLSWVVVSSIEDGLIDLSFNWARVGAIFAIGVAVGVVASLLPARRATRLDMLEAMRST